MGVTLDNTLDIGRMAEDRMPPVGVPVWVQCEGFRVMAYLDEDGKWRNFVTTAEVVGVMNWIGI